MMNALPPRPPAAATAALNPEPTMRPRAAVARVQGQLAAGPGKGARPWAALRRMRDRDDAGCRD